MRDLLITLGHNASAIVVEDGDVLNAYEAERLTGVKSDSRFPTEAIKACVERTARRAGGTIFDRIYATHWAPSGMIDDMKEKYWDRSAFRADVPIITSEYLALSHHDAHAHAAVAFAGEDFPKHQSCVLVIDGFGNFAEHFSYYRIEEKTGKLILMRRVYGYETSLGLMYQYATAFLGMKMHEDEYKLLGYGARVRGLDLNQDRIGEVAFKQMQRLLLRMRTTPTTTISLETLPGVQQMWADIFRKMLDDIGMQGIANDSEEARIALGYMVQRILEDAVFNLLYNDLGAPRNLIVTGGVHYNVALNRMLLRRVPGKLCCMPLAGDQGNSLGVWAFHNKKPLQFGDLCWGARDLRQTGELPAGLTIFEKDCDEVYSLIKESLENEGFVNLVRGKMEFGPRALCNTTTLARADNPNIAAEINNINGRNSVMPFAPVVWHEYLIKLFPDAAKMHKSAEFMICAADYAGEYGARFPGAALVTNLGHKTGRPQSYAPKYEGDSVARVLQEYGLLINTSFNVHGVPIVCDLKDVVHSHQYQRERNPNVRTIVIQEGSA